VEAPPLAASSVLGNQVKATSAEELVGHLFQLHLTRDHNTPTPTAPSTHSYKTASINCSQTGRGSACEYPPWLQCPWPSHPKVWWDPHPTFSASEPRRRGTTQTQDKMNRFQ